VLIWNRVGLHLNFDPATWGTVADWVGGTGTTLAFLATAYVVWRDAKVRRGAQTRKVAYYMRVADRASNEIVGKYTNWWIHEIHNLSDEPIYRGKPHMVNERGVRIPIVHRFREVLLPGESFTMQEEFYPSPGRQEIQFLDNSGRPWIRTLRGDLKEFHQLVEYWREGYNFLRWRKAYRDDPEPITRKYRRRKGP
jgi:hypothetical protein